MFKSGERKGMGIMIMPNQKGQLLLVMIYCESNYKSSYLQLVLSFHTATKLGMYFKNINLFQSIRL